MLQSNLVKTLRVQMLLKEHIAPVCFRRHAFKQVAVP